MLTEIGAGVKQCSALLPRLWHFSTSSLKQNAPHVGMPKLELTNGTALEAMPPVATYSLAQSDVGTDA